MATKRTSPKLALGVSLLIAGLLLFGSDSKKEYRDNSSTFAQEPIKVEGFTGGIESGYSLPKRIIIPDLNMDLVVEKARNIDGYWEVFPDKAGWGDGSGIPGQNGNQVIFAHAREGLFLPLRSIKVGMRIYILTDSFWGGYKVSEIKEVTPDQIEVIAPTPDETLTLYTCSGFKDSKRLIVVAKRMS